MSKAERLIGIFAVFGIVAAGGYWLYLYLSEGSAPSFSDLWGTVQGGFTSVTGIGKLESADIMIYASQAGFSGSDLDTAVAVALAESGGNPNAIGDVSLAPTNGPAIGLWQINSAKHSEYTAAQLKDPQTNANEAYAIFRAAGDFSPWTTFNTGAYEQYLPAQGSDLSASASEPSPDDLSDYGGEDLDG